MNGIIIFACKISTPFIQKNKIMRILTIFYFFLLGAFSYSQVVATGDTTLCEDMAGQVSLTLSAESFNVDLTDSGIYSDDTFGGVINIGFDFIFYGNTFNQAVLSSNNFLTFNLGNANNYSDWTITDPAPNNFDCPLNSILCPWQDIYPGVNGNGTIQYATTGEAPNRVFIASFCGIPMFSCTDICYTSQIKLYEGTNIIETHIAQKVLCTTWNGGAAIHGLHNDNGTIANIVTGLEGIERNYPNQWTCENDGWSFTPNGNNDYIIENITFAPAVAGTDIIWQDDNGNIIGTGTEIIVTPTESTVYTAGASLCGSAGDWCGFEGGIEGDEVFVNFIPTDITTSYTSPTCFGFDDGMIEIIFPSTDDWYYIIEENNNVVQQGTIQDSNSLIINNLTEGNYDIYVDNEFGCSDSESIILVEPTQMEDSHIEYNIDCFGENNGSISISLLGGTAPYSIFMGETNGTLIEEVFGVNEGSEVVFENLAPGDYFFTGLDNNGCLTEGDEVFFSIYEPEELMISYDSTDVTCSDANDGSIEITVSGGTIECPGDLGDVNNDQIINVEDIVLIIDLMLNNQYTLCGDVNCDLILDEEDVEIIENFILGIGEILPCQNQDYTYSWFGDNGFTSNEEDIENLAGGTYTLTITDQNSCSSSEIIEITEDAGIVIISSLSDYNGYGVSCENGSDGSIFISINGGTEPFTYLWTGPNGFQTNTEDLWEVNAGYYSLYLIDDNNCVAEENFYISEPEEVDILSGQELAWICETGGAAFSLVNGGVDPYDYFWAGPNGFQSNSSSIDNLNPGTYYLSVFDQNGCGSENNEINIDEIVGPICQFSASSYEFMLSNDPINFFDNSIADPNYDLEIISWNWDFGNGESSNEQNPSYIYEYPGLYYVWLTIEDENGCKNSTMHTINVLEEYFSYSPNAFSPNNDGINDTFQPILTDINFDTYELKIFNRWGDIIFKTEDYSNAWDGTFNGEPMMGGVYVYQINYETRRGNDQKELGQVILIK